MNDDRRCGVSKKHEVDKTCVKHLTRRSAGSLLTLARHFTTSPSLLIFHCTIMSEEKKSHDITPDENVAEEPQKHELVQETNRRKSVALNIVENPLRVSFWLCIVKLLCL